MKILMCHNYYQKPGGEDESYRSESALLSNYGNEVVKYELHNRTISKANKLTTAAKTIWNNRSFREISRLVKESKIEIAHFQNTFPLISPAAYYAAESQGAICIQALRNYRLMCVNGLFFRDGHICEDCAGLHFPASGIVHRCYRKSRVGSSVVSGMIALHKTLPTYRKVITSYIAVSEFVRQKYIEGGFSAENIYVKPNFVEDHFSGEIRPGGYFLFVGRLSSEKGIINLVSVFANHLKGARLKIVGDGPLRDRVAEIAAGAENIEIMGQRPLPEVYALMAQAQAVIVPSEWHEPFGRVVVESFAAGTPVIAASLGGLTELVDHERTGLLFRGGDAQSLQMACENFLSQSSRWLEFGKEARHEYQSKYTPQINYERMLEIYDLSRNTK